MSQHHKPYMEESVLRKFETYYVEGDENECWEWKGSYLGAGYPSFKINGRTIGGHRVMAKRELDEDLDLWPGRHSDQQVLHICDEPSCVNPRHLYIGDTSDNMQDRADRNDDLPSPADLCECPDECKVHGDRTGGNNPNAALTDAEAEEIRERYEPQIVTQQFLADEYGVSCDTVIRILNGDGY